MALSLFLSVLCGQGGGFAPLLGFVVCVVFIVYYVFFFVFIASLLAFLLFFLLLSMCVWAKQKYAKKMGFARETVFFWVLHQEKG